MFLLLSFLLSNRAGTCALPILSSGFPESSTQDLILDVTTTASTGACAGRSLWDILWSCLATTFACTWVSVHPNIPFFRESKASTTRWRVYLMVVSLIAPEIMILWACKQLQGALVIMETVNSSYDKADNEVTKDGSGREPRLCGLTTETTSKQEEKDNSPLWTLTHAQYLQMGGYRLQCLSSEEKLIPSRYGRFAKVTVAGRDRDIWELPLSLETMTSAFNSELIDIPFIRKDEILDKNGRDGLSKAIAMLQLTWFIVQIVARVRQNLAVTELELTTAALASLNIAMYVSWWSKPTDIQCPTIIMTHELEEKTRKWMRSTPSSPPDARDKINDINSLPQDRNTYTDQPLVRSLPLDSATSSSGEAKSHYVIKEIKTKKTVNLATYYMAEFTKSLRRSFVTLTESPARLVSGLAKFAMELKRQIRWIWDGSSHSDPTSKPLTIREKVRATISLIWKTMTRVFLALIYYPILAILESGSQVASTTNDYTSANAGTTTDANDSKSKEVINSDGQCKPVSKPAIVPKVLTPEDIETMPTVKLVFTKKALRFVMDMVFFCEDVASAPFLCLSALSGAIFGAIHCLAWNSEFPSNVEQILWRTCSSIIAGLCICIMSAALGYIIYQNSPWGTATNRETKPSEITEVACSVFAICFVLTRLSLISLSIIGLRALPTSAFDTVQWSGFIPHI